MATGTTTIDFGTFPGASHVTVAVTGQAAILGTSLVEAWLMPADTADHSSDEHVVETIKIIAGPPTAGVGFTIHGLNTSQINEPLAAAGPQGFRPAASSVYGSPDPSVGGVGTRLYGLWNVAWVWQ